jgi:hypothetical protein
MFHVALYVGDALPSVALVPGAIQVLRSRPELNYQIAREVLRPGLSAFFLPEPDEGGLVTAHDDTGIGAADK